MLKNNVIEVIQEQMLLDDECSEKKSYTLESQYEEATENEKKIIDNIFITLTGWTYPSLRNL